MTLRFLVLAVLAVLPVQGLQLPSSTRAVRPSGIGQRRAPPFDPLMISQEDKEYEEWKAKKLGNVAKLGSDENFGEYRRVESQIYLVGGLITILVPTIAGIWAYNEGYLTPQ